MKCQDLFSLENKKNFFECCLLQILLGTLRVKSASQKQQHMLQQRNKKNYFICIPLIYNSDMAQMLGLQDDQLEREHTTYLIKGGCTALVALFFHGKLYVANAGDSR